MCKLLSVAITFAIIGLTLNQAIAAPPATDEMFVTKAAQGGLAEVQMGQLAEQKGASPEVKQFGKMLADDHTQANQELQQIAQQTNIPLPSQSSSIQQGESRKLQSLSGAAFDKQFVATQLESHQKDIPVFKVEAESSTNPALKAFAQKTLPTLQKHLRRAEALSKAE
jgi:putative membrane protein